VWGWGGAEGGCSAMFHRTADRTTLLRSITSFHSPSLVFTRACTCPWSADVPEGKGVSSSAAVEVATMAALGAAHGLRLDGRRLALLCQKLENFVVGEWASWWEAGVCVGGGLHYVSVMGVQLNWEIYVAISSFLSFPEFYSLVSRSNSSSLRCNSMPQCCCAVSQAPHAASWIK
jgi:hypothetical protein